MACLAEAAYGKTEGFGEHSHRSTPETVTAPAPTLLTVPSPRPPQRSPRKSKSRPEHVSSETKPTEV